MASSTLAGLTAATSVATTGLVYIVNSPFGAGDDRKITFDNFQKSLGVVGKLTVTQPATSAVLTIADGKTLTASNTLTFTGTDSSSVAFGAGGTVLYTASTIPLTVGTTTIASGNDTRILFNNAGVLGQYVISGSGNVAMTTSPVFTTPNIGAATAASVNGLTITASTGTFTLTNGKTFAVTHGLTLSGTDSTVMTFPSTTATIARTDAGQTFTGVQVMTSPDVATSITSPSTTFTLFGSTVTTLNVAGASGAVVNLGGGANAAELRFLEPSGSGTEYTAFKAQAQGASITYTLPATVGGAGTFLTDAAGNGTLSWAAAGVSWGTSISGTTADGLTLTLSNSSNDAAGALKLIAGNTQSNQPVLANLQIGTSTNAMGLLIQGTGGGTGGAAGTGRNHLTIWGDTSANANLALDIGNGTSFASKFAVTAAGSVTINSPTDNRAITVNAPASMDAGLDIMKITASSTNANQICALTIAIGTSTNVMGIQVIGTGSTTGGAVGTGENHMTLWANTSNNANKVLSIGNQTSYAEHIYMTADGQVYITASGSNNNDRLVCEHTNGQAGVATPLVRFEDTANTFRQGGVLQVKSEAQTTSSNHTNIYSTSRASGALTACTVAEMAGIRNTYYRAHTGATTITDTTGYASFNLRTNVSNNASANYTVSSATMLVQQVATQTAGTLLVSGPVLQVIAPASSASFTGDVLQLVNNATTNLAFTATGNLCLGVGSAGATAANGVLCLGNGATAPTTSVDRVQLYAVDITAGNASLGIFTETAVVTETVVSDRTLAVKINGTDYKICLKV